MHNIQLYVSKHSKKNYSHKRTKAYESLEMQNRGPLTNQQHNLRDRSIFIDLNDSILKAPIPTYMVMETMHFYQVKAGQCILVYSSKSHGSNITIGNSVKIKVTSIR